MHNSTGFQSQKTNSVEYLGVEEDLGPEEAFVSDVNDKLFLGDVVDTVVGLQPLSTVRIVLDELFENVGAHVAVPLLNS